MKRFFLICALLSAPAYAVDRASDWLGHVVITADGEELGTVRDLAIDARTGKLIYLVVSVGSFLIENNLIAIAPEALQRSREPGVLLLEATSESLTMATRFANDSTWPAAPDVLRGETNAHGESAEAKAAESDPARPAGTATIESQSRTAHLSASERYVKETEKPAPPAPKPAVPIKPPPPLDAPFDRLDKDHDGVLSRSEFAHVITPKDSYSKLDANANGVIDRGEFDAFQQSKK